MIKRIFLGLGGTPYTAVAIQRAVELARQFGSLSIGKGKEDNRRKEKNTSRGSDRLPQPSCMI